MQKFLITGSNRGIGLELSRQIHERGDYVIATCRNASEELTNLGVNVIENVDISSGHSITKLKSKLRDIKLLNFKKMNLINVFFVNKKLNI